MTLRAAEVIVFVAKLTLSPLSMTNWPNVQLREQLIWRDTLNKMLKVVCLMLAICPNIPFSGQFMNLSGEKMSALALRGIQMLSKWTGTIKELYVCLITASPFEPALKPVVPS